VLGGKWIPRPELDGMLAEAERAANGQRLAEK